MKYYSISAPPERDILEFSDFDKCAQHVSTLNPEDFQIGEETIGKFKVSTKAVDFAFSQEDLFETMVVDTTKSFFDENAMMGMSKNPTWEHAKKFHDDVVRRLNEGEHIRSIFPSSD